MPDLDFAIVDPHFHHWDPLTTPRLVSPFARTLHRWPRAYEWVASVVMPRSVKDFLGGSPSMLYPYLPGHYAQDAAGLRIDTVVHVEAGWEQRGKLGVVGETRWLEQLDFERSGRRLGAIVGHADLRGADVDDVLAAHQAASERLRGIRQKAAHHPDRGVLSFCDVPNLYRDAAFLRGFEKVVARRLRFDAWVYSHQIPDVVELARRFPEARIVLDHMGTPAGVAGPVGKRGGVGATGQDRKRIFETWREDLARLAEHKQVHVKLSGLGMPVHGFDFHRRPSPPSVDELADAYRPFIGHALDVFGTERAFFASNFPMDKPSAPLAHFFGAYLELAKERGAEAPRALLRENALRFYACVDVRT
ncbi:MAG: amidohydrolase family protein [Panacagrimonas sp.]